MIIFGKFIYCKNKKASFGSFCEKMLQGMNIGSDSIFMHDQNSFLLL
jgi:hypothetical protein